MSIRTPREYDEQSFVIPLRPASIDEAVRRPLEQHVMSVDILTQGLEQADKVPNFSETSMRGILGELESNLGVLIGALQGVHDQAAASCAGARMLVEDAARAPGTVDRSQELGADMRRLLNEVLNPLIMTGEA